MKYDVIVIGGGIIGLSTGLNILEKMPQLKLALIEKENRIAKHQTGNNSGVIHSGIYYKPGSSKAENCITGYRMLIDFCEKHGIKYDLCGKLIIASEKSELQYLDDLYNRGIQNGLSDLIKLSPAGIKEYEPYAEGIAGIFVPQTGIIDFVEVADKYKSLIENYGGEINLSEKVIDILSTNGGLEIITDKRTYSAKFLVTCGGLQSDRIAKITNKNLPLRIIPFRGEYYKLKPEKRYLVNSLIYPVPNPAFPFLGVHFTKLINGGVEAGPNAVLAFKREGYHKLSFNLKDTTETLTWPGFLTIVRKYWKTGLGEFYRSFNKKAFVRALQKLIPEMKSEYLVPGGAGVRAQACNNQGGLVDDFYIIENEKVFHVCNAPSPAATSSLSIGNYIANKIINSINMN